MTTAIARDVMRVKPLVHSEESIIRSLRERFAPERKRRFQQELLDFLLTRKQLTSDQERLGGMSIDSFDEQARQDYRDEVKNVQNLLTQLQFRINLHEETLRGMSQSELMDPVELLQLIRAIPQVVKVGLFEHSFCVVVRTTYEYDGVRYDMGDWLLQFPNYWLSNQAPAYFTTRELRTGRRFDIITSNGAIYRAKEREFCFGHENAARIYKFARQGLLVQAIVLAISFIEDVNDGDESYVQYSFKTAD